MLFATSAAANGALPDASDWRILLVAIGFKCKK
jgi:hypothetical protein